MEIVVDVVFSVDIEIYIVVVDDDIADSIDDVIDVVEVVDVYFKYSKNIL